MLDSVIPPGMRSGLRWLAAGVALSGLLLLLFAVYNRGRDAQARADAAELRGQRLTTENAIAAHEANRRLIVGAHQVAVQRALQLAQERDEIDAALEAQRRSAARLVVALDTLRERIAGMTAPDTGDDVRRAVFHVARELADITADVALPRPPDTPWLQLQVAWRPIELEVRTLCGARSAESGLRPALHSVATRQGVRVEVASASADPDVCNPIVPPISLWERVKIAARPTAAGVLAGAVIAFLLAQ